MYIYTNLYINSIYISNITHVNITLYRNLCKTTLRHLCGSLVTFNDPRCHI